MTGDNRVSQGSNPEDNGCGQQGECYLWCQQRQTLEANERQWIPVWGKESFSAPGVVEWRRFSASGKHSFWGDLLQEKGGGSRKG
jgi:hypothetical protein